MVGDEMISDLHINKTTSTKYQGMVRCKYQRSWMFARPSRQKKEDAIMDMTRKFATDKWTHGVVLMTADWYAPIQVVEMSYNDT